jgi:hypothetical protein
MAQHTFRNNKSTQARTATSTHADSAYRGRAAGAARDTAACTHLCQPADEELSLAYISCLSPDSSVCVENVMCLLVWPVPPPTSGRSLSRQSSFFSSPASSARTHTASRGRLSVTRVSGLDARVMQAASARRRQTRTGLDCASGRPPARQAVCRRTSVVAPPERDGRAEGAAKKGAGHLDVVSRVGGKHKRVLRFNLPCERPKACRGCVSRRRVRCTAAARSARTRATLPLTERRERGAHEN